MMNQMVFLVAYHFDSAITVEQALEFVRYHTGYRNSIQTSNPVCSIAPDAVSVELREVSQLKTPPRT